MSETNLRRMTKTGPYSYPEIPDNGNLVYVFLGADPAPIGRCVRSHQAWYFQAAGDVLVNNESASASGHRSPEDAHAFFLALNKASLA